MKNMRISLKLIVSFVTAIVFAIIVGVVGYMGIRSLNGAESRMYNSNLLAIEAIGNLRELFANERNTMRSIILSQDNPQTVKNLIDFFADYDKMAAENFALYESTIEDESLETAYYTAKNTWLGTYANLLSDCIALINAGQFDEAYETYITVGTPIVAPITNGLAESATLNSQWAAQANQNGDALYFRLTVILIIALALAVLISMVLAFYISGLISKPVIVLTAFMKRAGGTGDIALSQEDKEVIGKYAQVRDEIGQCIASCAQFVGRLHEVGGALETVAGGDLSVELALLSERDTMGNSLKKMLENLNHMFSEINSATAQVTIGSKQIADGAQSLAQGSTEQASAVQELSASISEIAQKTKENAEMALTAANLAGNIKQNAEKGNTQMDQMMKAVKEINDASASISKVIKVIDDIAFQTNILALNAAVEAARAGQHGKGFAVVAEEVRSLAGKSAEAAKETGALIANSMDKAEMGARIADETAASLVEIISGINKSTKIVNDIAQSSNAQASAITEINSGIDQVAQVVQQNSATAEQSAAASEQMSGQANALEDLVAQFKLKGASNQLGMGARKARRQIPENTPYSGDSGLRMGKY